MYDNIVSIVDLLIGEVPLEFEFVKGLAVLAVFLIIIFCAIFPFYLLWTALFRKW